MEKHYQQYINIPSQHSYNIAHSTKNTSSILLKKECTSSIPFSKCKSNEQKVNYLMKGVTSPAPLSTAIISYDKSTTLENQITCPAAQIKVRLVGQRKEKNKSPRISVKG